MRRVLVRVQRFVAAMMIVLIATIASAQVRQPTGVKATAELFEDPELTKSKQVSISKKESAAIEALVESGSSVEVRCGDKRGWVDRSELEYSLPSLEDCREGGPGSSRGSNRCR